MKPILAAALAAATALSALPAFADSTTVIRQSRTVVPDRPTVAVPVAQTTHVRKVVHKTVVRRRAITRHMARPAAASPQPVARSAMTRSVDTSATVRQDSDMPADAYRPTGSGAVTEERKTVIHRDDDGNVTRHTRIIRQDPNGGMTATEHRSSEGPDYDADREPDSAP